MALGGLSFTAPAGQTTALVGANGSGKTTLLSLLAGLIDSAEGRAEALVRRITGDNGQHVVSYGTEAGQFQSAGYSSIVCGPGNIAQAHQPDEFITVEQFRRGEEFVGRVVDTLCDSA